MIIGRLVVGGVLLVVVLLLLYVFGADLKTVLSRSPWLLVPIGWAIYLAYRIRSVRKDFGAINGYWRKALAPRRTLFVLGTWAILFFFSK